MLKAILKKVLKEKYCTKSISLFIALALVFTSVSSNIAYAMPMSTAMPVVNSINTSKFVVPFNIGRITDALYNGKSKEIIVNIQDLHSHEQTQRNISSILSMLDKKYGIDKIYVEGAIGKVDTSLISNIADKDVKAKVVNNLLKSGRLTGSELYSIESGRNNILEGIENKEVYLRNVDRLNEIYNKKSEIEQYLPKVKYVLEETIKEYYSNENTKLNKIIEKNKKGKISASKYFEYIVRFATRAGIDINRYSQIVKFIGVIENQKGLKTELVNKEVAELLKEIKNEITFKEYKELTQKVNNKEQETEFYNEIKRIAEKDGILSKYPNATKFFNYIQMNESLNPVELANEEKEIITQIQDRNSNTIYEKEAYFLKRYIGLVEGYLSNKMTADEYTYFVNNKSRFDLLWKKYVDIDGILDVQKYFSLFEEFYKDNIERNKIFVEKITGKKVAKEAKGIRIKGRVDNKEKIVEEINSGKKIKVVITGGFHTYGFTRLLEDNGIDYCVITPNITQETLTAERLYENVFKEQYSLQNQTFQKKLFLQVINELLKEAEQVLDVRAQGDDVVIEYLDKNNTKQVRTFVNNEEVASGLSEADAKKAAKLFVKAFLEEKNILKEERVQARKDLIDMLETYQGTTSADTSLILGETEREMNRHGMEDRILRAKYAGFHETLRHPILTFFKSTKFVYLHYANASMSYNNIVKKLKNIKQWEKEKKKLNKLSNKYFSFSMSTIRVNDEIISVSDRIIELQNLIDKDKNDIETALPGFAKRLDGARAIRQTGWLSALAGFVVTEALIKLIPIVIVSLTPALIPSIISGVGIGILFGYVGAIKQHTNYDIKVLSPAYNTISDIKSDIDRLFAYGKGKTGDDLDIDKKLMDLANVFRDILALVEGHKPGALAAVKHIRKGDKFFYGIYNITEMYKNDQNVISLIDNIEKNFVKLSRQLKQEELSVLDFTTKKAESVSEISETLEQKKQSVLSKKLITEAELQRLEIANRKYWELHGTVSGVDVEERIINALLDDVKAIEYYPEYILRDPKFKDKSKEDIEAQIKYKINSLIENRENAYKTLAFFVNMDLLSQEEQEAVAKEIDSAKVKFGTAGHRGEIADDYNSYINAAITLGTSKIINSNKKSKKKVILCHDSRYMSFENANLASVIFRANGIDVDIIDGISSTPAISNWAKYHDSYDATFNETASHNPYLNNGKKPNNADGSPALPSFTDQITSESTNYISKNFKNYSDASSTWKKNLETIKENRIKADDSGLTEVQKSHINNTLNIFANSLSRSAEDLRSILNGLNLVIDFKNSALEPEMRSMFGYLGASLDEQYIINSGRDITFGGKVNPEPSEDNTGDLKEKVEKFANSLLKEGKSIEEIVRTVYGIATDPDGDRFCIYYVVYNEKTKRMEAKFLKPDESGIIVQKVVLDQKLSALENELKGKSNISYKEAVEILSKYQITTVKSADTTDQINELAKVYSNKMLDLVFGLTSNKEQNEKKYLAQRAKEINEAIAKLQTSDVIKAKLLATADGIVSVLTTDIGFKNLAEITKETENLSELLKGMNIDVLMLLESSGGLVSGIYDKDGLYALPFPLLLMYIAKSNPQQILNEAEKLVGLKEDLGRGAVTFKDKGNLTADNQKSSFLSLVAGLVNGTVSKNRFENIIKDCLDNSAKNGIKEKVKKEAAKKGLKYSESAFKSASEMLKGQKIQSISPLENGAEILFENGNSLIIRASGTEPKIRAYTKLKADIEGKTDAEIAKTGKDSAFNDIVFIQTAQTLIENSGLGQYEPRTSDEIASELKDYSVKNKDKIDIRKLFKGDRSAYESEINLGNDTKMFFSMARTNIDEKVNTLLEELIESLGVNEKLDKIIEQRAKLFDSLLSKDNKAVQNLSKISDEIHNSEVKNVVFVVDEENVSSAQSALARMHDSRIKNGPKVEVVSVNKIPSERKENTVYIYQSSAKNKTGFDFDYTVNTSEISSIDSSIISSILPMMVYAGNHSLKEFIEGAKKLDSKENRQAYRDAVKVSLLYRYVYGIEVFTLANYDNFAEPLIKNEQEEFKGVLAILGRVLTDAQHSFFQWIHQGVQKTFVIFIGSATTSDEIMQNSSLLESFKNLLANMIAQADGLAEGKDDENPHKQFKGNRASVMLVKSQANATSAGAETSLFSTMAEILQSVKDNPTLTTIEPIQEERGDYKGFTATEEFNEVEELNSKEEALSDSATVEQTIALDSGATLTHKTNISQKVLELFDKIAKAFNVYEKALDYVGREIDNGNGGKDIIVKRRVNTTEDRFVLHPAHSYVSYNEETNRFEPKGKYLVKRDYKEGEEYYGDGKNYFNEKGEADPNGEYMDVMVEIIETLNKEIDFLENLYKSGIKTVVSFGIGGSDLGPRNFSNILSGYKLPNSPEIRFVHNVDPNDIVENLRDLDPMTTYGIIQSKSFGTAETLSNGKSFKSWQKHGFIENFKQGFKQAIAEKDLEAKEKAIEKSFKDWLENGWKEDKSNIPEEELSKFYSEHLAAVSSQAKLVSEFGIDAEKNMFPFTSAVGGRYSVFSPVGLPLMLSIGSENFAEALAGETAVYSQFRKDAQNGNLIKNPSFIMAIRNIFNINVLGKQVQAIDTDIEGIAAYDQQTDMESRGKHVTEDGKDVGYRTGNAVVEFNGYGVPELVIKKQDGIEFKFNKNEATSEVRYKKVTPEVLGALKALLDLMIIVSSLVWKIIPVDQWGVQLGKVIAKVYLGILNAGKVVAGSVSKTTEKVLNSILKEQAKKTEVAAKEAVDRDAEAQAEKRKIDIVQLPTDLQRKVSKIITIIEESFSSEEQEKYKAVVKELAKADSINGSKNIEKVENAITEGKDLKVLLDSAFALDTKGENLSDYMATIGEKARAVLAGESTSPYNMEDLDAIPTDSIEVLEGEKGQKRNDELAQAGLEEFVLHGTLMGAFGGAADRLKLPEGPRVNMEPSLLEAKTYLEKIFINWMNDTVRDYNESQISKGNAPVKVEKLIPLMTSVKTQKYLAQALVGLGYTLYIRENGSWVKAEAKIDEKGNVIEIEGKSVSEFFNGLEDSGIVKLEWEQESVNAAKTFYLMNQIDVPAVSDFNATLSYKDGKFQGKAGGHGDMHYLMKKYGMFDELEKAGITNITFTQDNVGSISAILPMVGKLKEGKNLVATSVAAKPGAKVGKLFRIRKADGSSVIANVEYNVVDEMRNEAKARIEDNYKEFARNHTKEEVVEQKNKDKAFIDLLESAEPNANASNINLISISVSAYKARVDARLPYLFNPKKENRDGELVMTSDSRMELSFQDIMLEMTDSAVLDYAGDMSPQIFSAIKNSILDGEVFTNKIETAIDVEVNTAERELKNITDAVNNYRKGEAKVVVDGQKRTFEIGKKIEIGPRIVQRIAVLSQDLAKHFKGNVHWTNRSDTVFEGNVYLENVDFDGAVDIRLPEGVTATVTGVFENAGYKLTAMTPKEVSDILSNNEKDKVQQAMRGLLQEKISVFELGEDFFEKYGKGSYTIEGKSDGSVTVYKGKEVVAQYKLNANGSYDKVESSVVSNTMKNLMSKIISPVEWLQIKAIDVVYGNKVRETIVADTDSEDFNEMVDRAYNLSAKGIKVDLIILGKSTLTKECDRQLEVNRSQLMYLLENKVSDNLTTYSYEQIENTSVSKEDIAKAILQEYAAVSGEYRRLLDLPKSFSNSRILTDLESTYISVKAGASLLDVWVDAYKKIKNKVADSTVKPETMRAKYTIFNSENENVVTDRISDSDLKAFKSQGISTIVLEVAPTFYDKAELDRVFELLKENNMQVVLSFDMGEILTMDSMYRSSKIYNVIEEITKNSKFNDIISKDFILNFTTIEDGKFGEIKFEKMKNLAEDMMRYTKGNIEIRANGYEEQISKDFKEAKQLIDYNTAISLVGKIDMKNVSVYVGSDIKENMVVSPEEMQKLIDAGATLTFDNKVLREMTKSSENGFTLVDIISAMFLFTQEGQEAKGKNIGRKMILDGNKVFDNSKIYEMYNLLSNISTDNIGKITALVEVKVRTEEEAKGILEGILEAIELKAVSEAEGEIAFANKDDLNEVMNRLMQYRMLSGKTYASNSDEVKALIDSIPNGSDLISDELISVLEGIASKATNDTDKAIAIAGIIDILLSSRLQDIGINLSESANPILAAKALLTSA